MKAVIQKKLGEVCGFVRGPFGGSLKKECFKPSGYAVYEQQHAIYDQFEEVRYYIDEEKFQEMLRFELRSGDLIMSCSGTMGKVAIVPNGIQKGIINQALLKLSPKKDLDVYYLKYWMQSPDFQYSISSLSLGAAIKNVASVSVLKEITLPVPPIEEQQRIVSILDEAFEAIDKAKANIERNIQNARELFQSRLNEIFTEKGEGWVVKLFTNVVTLKSGTTVNPLLEKSQGDIAYLKVADFNVEGNEFQITTSTRYLDKIDVNPKHVFPVGTTIFPKRGGAIATEKKRITNIPTCLDLNVMGAIPSKELLPRYLYHFFMSFNLMDIANGTTILQINNYSFDKTQIPVPPLVEQERIVAELDKLSERTKEYAHAGEKKLAYLNTLKQSLLQKAFSGELTQTPQDLEI